MSAKPATSKPIGKFVAITCHSTSLFPAQGSVIMRKLSASGISLCRERKDWNIHRTCRLFRGLPEGLILILPESKCWQERATNLGSLKTEAHTHLPWSLPPAHHGISRRNPPTPSFSLGRERVGSFVQHSGFLRSYPKGTGFCLTCVGILLGVGIISVLRSPWEQKIAEHFAAAPENTRYSRQRVIELDSLPLGGKRRVGPTLNIPAFHFLP